MRNRWVGDEVGAKTKMRRFLKKVLIVFLAVLVSGVYTTPIYALSNKYLDMFSQNNILFYDPDEKDQYGNNCVVDRPGGNKIIWIGDTYSVEAENEKLIIDKLPGVNLYIQDGKVFSDGVNNESSSNPTGLALLKKIINKDEMKSFLVFALGSEGGVTEEYINELVNLAGANTHIVLTTLYAKNINYSSSNNVIRKAAADYNNITVADWAAVAKSEYYDGDPSGMYPVGHYKDWVDLIYEALPISGDGGSSNTSVEVSNNKLYNGDPVLSDSLLEKVRQNQSFYETAANKYGFPWQIIAVLHIREHSAERSNPDNGQGIYQLYSYTDGGTNSNAFYPAGSVSDEEFARQTDILANLIKNGYGAGLDLNTESGIKRLFFQYNGLADVYIAQARDLGFTEEEANWGEGSPYVMNMADERRDPTKNPNWKQIVYDGGSAINYPSNTEPGAYLMYMVLGGVGSMCSEISGGGGSINGTALLLSWPDREHSPDDPKPEYKVALAETGVNKLGDECSMKGASCDAFIATVMRYSGVDADFPCCGVNTQYNYLISHPELYEEIPNIGSAENMQPGDIRVESGSHIEMYVVLEDGTGAIASASHCDRTGDHGISYYANSGFIIFRKK